MSENQDESNPINLGESKLLSKLPHDPQKAQNQNETHDLEAGISLPLAMATIKTILTKVDNLIDKDKEELKTVDKEPQQSTTQQDPTSLQQIEEEDKDNHQNNEGIISLNLESECNEPGIQHALY